MSTDIVVQRNLCRHVPHGAVAEPRRLTVRLRHAQATDVGSMIRINQNAPMLDVSVDDAMRVLILDAVDHIREHIRLCYR